MKKLLVALVMAGCAGWLAPWAAPAHADTLEGVVQAADGTPIAGLTTYLVHPTIGRSSAVITNALGGFLFRNVPHIEEPYFLEIYWGSQLIYRARQYVGPYTALPSPIVLGG